MDDRPSKAEIIRRVDDIYPLVLSCVRRREIIRFVVAKTDWGHVCERTIERYIARCNHKIAASSKVKWDLQLGGAIERLRDLYARASARGDLGEARMNQKDLTQLLGLAAPAKIEVEVTDADRKKAEDILTERIKAALIAEAQQITRESSQV